MAGDLPEAEQDTPSERERFTQETKFKEREIKAREDEVSCKRDDLTIFREREIKAKENEVALKRQDVENFRAREIKAKEDEVLAQHEDLEIRRSFLRNPLTLAIVGATIAGGANIWVALHNGIEQRAVERQKAEDERIVSVITADTANAIARLRFLIETGLITNPDTKSGIEAYINSHQVVNSPAIQAPKGPLPAATRRVTLDTGRLGGGHNQQDECARLKAQVEAQNTGQQVTLVGTSEDSEKDFLGHVTYNYHCIFDIHS